MSQRNGNNGDDMPSHVVSIPVVEERDKEEDPRGEHQGDRKEQVEEKKEEQDSSIDNTGDDLSSDGKKKKDHPKGGGAQKEGSRTLVTDSSFSSSEEELPYYAPPELQMSDREQGRALGLVNRMENLDGGIDGHATGTGVGTTIPPSVSDYEYALYAIVTDGNNSNSSSNKKNNHTEIVEKKIRTIQEFRRKYNIQDTVEQGIQAFKDFLRLHPGHLLHVDTMGPRGSLLVVDLGKWVPSRVRESDKNFRTQMVFCYYVFQLCVVNFDVARGGIQLLAEGSGVSYRNMDVGLEKQILQELRLHLPLKWNQIRLYNNSPVITSLMDLLKPFLPTEVQDVISCECQLENSCNPSHQWIQLNDSAGPPALNGILNALCPPPPVTLTLPQVFLQPNYDVAMQNLMTKVRTLLEERYRNEETFELFADVPPPP